MSHVYSSCFDYPKKHIFFLELIQTHIFVSQGSIKFEKKCKNSNVESLDKAPMNGWLDGLRHFKKSIHFKDKYMMMRPQMKGRTGCVMLKNDSF